jgi:flavin-binding protein dodecin
MELIKQITIKNAIQEDSKTVKNIQWAELGRVTVKVDKKR